MNRYLIQVYMLSSSNLQYKLEKYRYRYNLNKKPIYQSKIEYYQEMFDLLNHQGGQLFANLIESMNRLEDNFSINIDQLNGSISGINKAVQENTDAMREAIKVLKTIRLTFDSTKYQKEIDKVTQKLKQENAKFQLGGNLIDNFAQTANDKADEIEQVDKSKDMNDQIQNLEDVLETFKEHQKNTTNSMINGVTSFDRMGENLDRLIETIKNELAIK